MQCFKFLVVLVLMMVGALGGSHVSGRGVWSKVWLYSTSTTGSILSLSLSPSLPCSIFF